MSPCRKLITAFFSVSAALLLLCAAEAQAAKNTGKAAPAILEVTHKSGKTNVALSPKRLIVFDLATLDTLNILGITGIVGVPDQKPLPTYLKAYGSSAYPKAGTLFEPDYEAVAAAKPDLIIVAGRSQPKYHELAKIAPTIDLTVGLSDYLGDVEHNITLLGQIFGKEKQAEKSIESLNAAIAALKTKAANKGTGLVILTTGGKISVFGAKSRFGIFYDNFGIKCADPNLTAGTHGQPVSAEFLLAANPDWLFVIDRDAAIGAEGQSARQILDNAIINQTKAAQKNHILYLDAQNSYLVGGSLSALQETIAQINAAFDASESAPQNENNAASDKI